jgi:hypothetical protein
LPKVILEESKTTERIKESNVIELWAKNYPEVTRWLAKLQKKEQSAHSLYRFCEWCNRRPPELLEAKAKDASINPPPNEVEKLLDDFIATDISGFTNIIKYHCTMAVKSFFKHNYRDLARASGAMDLEQVKPYNKLTKEGLRKLWSWAQNLRDKALMTFVCSTAIAKETLTNLKWSHLEENWEKIDLPCINIPSALLKGHGQGKYKNVRQTTFMTPEAKRDLINYKEWLEQKLGRKMTAEDNIWLETYAPYRPLSYSAFGLLIWQLSKNTGVPFSWHDARRWVNTALEQIGISSNWARKIRGRKVRGEEAPYSQPAIEQLREKFREAVPLLEFISERPQVPKEILDRIAKMEDEVKAEKRQYGLLRKKSQIKAPENCEDGHCGEEFKQIGETLLLEHLKAGWKITHNLGNGEIIVQK